MINWKQKLSSRKFWALLAALATSVLVIFKVDTELAHEITAMITAAGACVAYILAEAHVDANRDNTEESND